MADEYIGLTCQALCDGLSTLKRAYETSDTDFDLRWTVGEFGKGQITTSINIKVLLSDAVSMLKHQQAEIERLKQEGKNEKKDTDDSI